MNELTFLPLAAVCIGIILDALLGDPRWLPHPIRLFGEAIARCEQQYNKGKRKLKGVLTGVGLVLGTGLLFFGLESLIRPFPYLHCLFNGIILFYGICPHSLVEEALKVEKQLLANDIPQARHQLSRIVGRETDTLTPSQIRAAVLETLSENLGDGVVAPLFYYAIGGVPGIMMYKMINTLDSMIGYKNDRFAEFGWFSARLDDVANLLPARLTALLMVLCPPRFEALGVALRYGKQHTSPNAGYPEAALAGLLRCRLGGANSYHGSIIKKPFIGERERELNHADIVAGCRIVIKVTVISYLALLITEAIRSTI